MKLDTVTVSKGILKNSVSLGLLQQSVNEETLQGNFLLLEDVNFLLLENGSRILLED
ncbi:hypothetical protein KKC59_00290 [bacterium]|nr:hypothetical protein [bacterium]